MNWLPEDDTPDEDYDMLQDYMEKIRTQTIEKLTALEIAALFEDFKEFQIRLREQIEENRYVHEDI